MSGQWTRQQCLAVVEDSPRAVAVHDKTAWLALFTRIAVVEDPVGSRPVVCGLYDRRRGRRGWDALARFYDTFIAPNDIVFHVERDLVEGLQVVRDLDIEIRMSPAVVVRVPMHLLYELAEENGVLKIQRLAAHWELLPMLQRQMAFGLSSLTAGSAAFIRMLRHLGVGGALGFLQAVRGVGSPGKQSVTTFIEAFNAGDSNRLQDVFSPGAVCDWQSGAAALAPDALPLDGRILMGKLLAAGDIVSASLEWQQGENRRYGVVLFELDRRCRINHLHAYWQE